MRTRFWFVLAAFLFLRNAPGQISGGQSPAPNEKAVEENLHFLTVIKGRPDPGMSLADQMSRLHVPGVSIAVIRDKRIDWSKGYDVVRLGGAPVSTSTLFSAASMSKPVTAMAILRLVQEGKIDLDVDVNTYLKAWKISANEYTKDHPVTVRELLSHTSGIGTHNGMIYNPATGVPSILEILNGKPPATTPPVRVEWEPGTKYAYANGGYLILELLISELTGKPFAEAMKELVLTPIGMNNSTFKAPLSPEEAATAATAYDEGGTNGYAPAQIVEPNAAAGGLWTTAIDYAKFIIELEKEYDGESHRVLNQKMARAMVTAGMGPSDSIRWGLGVRVGGTQPNIYFEHGGSAVYQCDMVGYPSGNGVVVLTSGGEGGPLSDQIVRSVAQTYDWPDFKPVEHIVVPVEPSKFDRYVGTYDFIKVTQDGSHLMAEIPLGSKAQELFPESNTQYFLRDAPTRVIFDVNTEGKVTGLEFITTYVHWHRDKKP
ncbi:serine hydrolase [Acidicapsa acidisoli]|uniref:serine hydrolase n=1 Tax=Acidicapsa acidisoli TaxID=1615681 RepID=UPI0021E07A12|nr:serine hydrolase [Acidicapsa acidisoli]